MVRTRQEATADSSPVRHERLVETGDRGLERDPLVDTASFVPAGSVQSGQGESSGLRDERRIFGGDGQGTQSPPTVAPAAAPPGVAPPPYPDPTYFAQLVRAVMTEMAGPLSTTLRDNVVTLVRWVKSLRELGCEAFMGEEDAEIAGRWLRKIERSMDQIAVPAELRVDCATQLLSDRAQTWWDIVKERRATETLRWRDFRTEFENQYYSRQHRKIKEHEFLALTQGDMTVLEYERRFQDLSMFASVYLPTEQHRIERLRDGLRQELRMGLAALQFPTVRDFIVAAQSLEAVAAAGRREGDGQGTMGTEKRKEPTSFTGRPPFPKKGKGGHFGQFRKKGGNLGSGGTSSRPMQSSQGGWSRPHTILSGGVVEGSRMATYPLCVRCERRHPGDCSITSGRCYVCRQEHRWRDCPYLDAACYYCGESGHRRRECPQRTMGQTQRQGFSGQSQQQSVTVDRPGRPAQSGTSAIRGRPRVQGRGAQGRVFRMTQEDVRAATDVVAGVVSGAGYQTGGAGSSRAEGTSRGDADH